MSFLLFLFFDVSLKVTDKWLYVYVNFLYKYVKTNEKIFINKNIYFCLKIHI